ncbi:hypothetical protein [Salipiger mucosus]|uniref:Secreted protein n=1 Tax=Salipiger mucosus DSM 16094 TaxID=1123237 RepID=S9QW34_9RHOB|nr:hypothetical protein [Salipiger mucosus]EPX85581.1 hypothetical protein Salmuc_04852 [Salipiger mucosus DSM 16094]
MTRLIALTTAAACAAAAAFAATETLSQRPGDVIEIEVAPERLAECRETLQQVAQRPAVTDDGSPILVDTTEDLPGVVCVAVPEA